MTKIRKSQLACFLYFMHTSLFAQLVPYRDGDQWGYADANGKIVVPVQFEEAYPFLSQLEMFNPNYNAEYSQTNWPDLKSPVAVFKKNGLYGLLGSNGQVLSAPCSASFFQFEPASKGTFWVRYNNGDKNQDGAEVLKNALLYDGGAKLTPFQYEYTVDDYGEDGSEGRGGYFSFVRTEMPDHLVIYKNGKSGVISIKGEELIPPVWWDIAIPSDEGFTIVCSYSDTVLIEGYTGIGYYLLNPNNQIVKKLPQIGSCQGYVGQGLWALQKDGRIWLINTKGERVTSDYYYEFFGFNEDGFAEVNDSMGKWRIINTRCETVQYLEYEGQCSKYSEGYWKMEKDSFWYRYDHHFQKADKVGYLEPFTEISLCGKKYWMFKSRDGQWRIKNNPEVQHAFDFNVVESVLNQSDEWGRKFDQQFLRIEKNGKNGMADCQLRVIIPPQFHYFTLFYGPNLWKIANDGKLGIFDAAKRQVILPVEFDEIQLHLEGAKHFISVRQGKFWGVYDLNGKEILPVIFENNLSSIPYVSLVKSKKGWHIFDETLKEIAAFTLPPHDENPSPSLFKQRQAGNDSLGIMVNIQGKRALFNQEGQMLIPPDYDNFRIQDDYIIAQKEGKFGVLLYPELCEFIPFEYEYIGYVKRKFILEKSKNSKKFIYYDPALHKKIIVQSPKYTLSGWFNEGLIVAVKDCNFGFLDEQLNEVIPLRYRSARGFSEGLAAVEYSNKLWGFINKQGEEVIKPKYIEAESFHQGKSIVRFHHLPDSAVWSSVIDHTGRELITFPELNRIGPFIIVRKTSSAYAVLDSNLQTVIDQCYIAEKNEQEGYLHYLENGRPGFLSADGRKTPADYKLTRLEYPDGRIGVNFISACWGLQDQKGQWLIPLLPQWVRSDGNGEYFILTREEKNGLFNRNGNQLIPFQYSNLEVKGNFCEANMDGLLGLFDLKGNLIVPVKFSSIEVLSKLELIKVTTTENKIGFFDFKGRQYFKE